MTTLAPDNSMLVLALKSISDCVCISDMDDNIIFVNDSFLNTYGYTSEELLGKPVSTVRSVNNKPETISGIFPATLQGGWRGEVVNCRKDGSEFIVNIATSVIHDDKGKPMALMGIAKDVTETKRMQEKFRMVADLFQSLGTDTSGNINTIVACACSVVGGAASLYNRLDDSSCSLVVWAGHNLPAEMERSDSPGGHICYEATIKGQNKTVILNDLSNTTYMMSDPNVSRFGLKSYIGAPVLRRGKVIGALAVVDLVERMFAPEEIDLIGILAKALSLEEDRQDALTLLETAVQQSPSGIVVADAPDVRIRLANSKAQYILLGKKENCESLKLNESVNSWECFSLNGRPIQPKDHPLARAVKDGKVTDNEELIIRAGTNIEHVVSVNAAPVRNSEGIITSGVVIFHDITGKRKTEYALEEKVAELKRFNNLMIGRELKMIELKKEVNELLVNADKPEKYFVQSHNIHTNPQAND